MNRLIYFNYPTAGIDSKANLKRNQRQNFSKVILNYYNSSIRFNIIDQLFTTFLVSFFKWLHETVITDNYVFAAQVLRYPRIGLGAVQLLRGLSTSSGTTHVGQGGGASRLILHLASVARQTYH